MGVRDSFITTGTSTSDLSLGRTLTIQQMESAFATSGFSTADETIDIWGSRNRPKAPAGSASTESLADRERLTEANRRLLKLRLAFMEDFQRPLVSESARAAEVFLNSNPQTASGLYSAEPSGYVIATWRRGAEVIAIRFLGKGRSHFTAAKQSPAHAHLSRTWGFEDPDALLKKPEFTPLFSS